MQLELAQAIIGADLEHIFLVVVLGLLRIFGLTWGFLGFSWAFGHGVMLRIAVSMALGFPIIVAQADQTALLAQTAGALDLVLLATKEFALGFAFGFLISSPFRALQYAGAVTDAFRGESDSGITDPHGGQLQTFSMLYLAIGFAVFASIGGIWRVIAKIYETYLIWPINLLYPQMSEDFAQLMVQGLMRSLELAVLIALPLLILLFATEFALMVSARLARRFGMYDLSFLTKNLVTIFTLPLTAMLILRVAETRSPDAVLGFEYLQQLLE